MSKYEVKGIQCKVNDIYRIDDITEEVLLDQKLQRERYAYHREEDAPTDTPDWIDNQFYLLLTDYNLHLKNSTKYQPVSRDLLVEAHKNLRRTKQNEEILEN